MYLKSYHWARYLKRMTLKLSPYPGDFHFKTRFLFRNAYDISINNYNQTFSNEVEEKKNIFAKQLKTMVAFLREKFKWKATDSMPMVYQMNKTNLKKPSCYSHKSEKTYCSCFTCLHPVNVKSIWSVYTVKYLGWRLLTSSPCIN